MLVRILVAVPRAPLARRLQRLLASPSALVSRFEDPGEDLGQVDREDFDIAVVARDLLGDRAEAVIARLRALPDRPEVVVVAGNEDAQDRARLVAAGCLAVINETLPDKVLRPTLLSLGQRRRESIESPLTQPGRSIENRSRLQDFATRSPSMQQFMTLARRVVDADSSLLLAGETGVGKEWLARAIHMEGRRSAGPFVAINCGAVPETLLESELFGHEKGAFTGAGRARRGYFELAHRGTLFLDEIGDLPHHLQVKLLRVLQERSIMRIGSEHAIAVDVRVMAATNRDLETEMGGGRFRPDLYYRLSVVTLTLPPLRERREDIPALVESYLSHYRTALRRPVVRIVPAAMEALIRYGWPGNVRELINTIERAVLLATGSEIGLADLPQRIGAPAAGTARRGAPGKPVAPPAGAGDLLNLPIRQARREMLRAFEREYLDAQLRASRGRIRETAARAGINARSLYDLMRRHGLRKEAFKR
ncbi:MAG TPA: sigma-54 dependent transcriptional regulator [Candidatus Saccharimonadales bacterium]|nr:sigma-54 dependent transcriptional regulator [Candidatus Saccharimonadales bacterium]